MIRVALRIERASSQVAGAQARWIVAAEPWRGLGYRAATLGRWLSRMARQEAVWIARARAGAPVQGIVVVQGGFLLGSFVALIAVKAAEAGRGIGGGLMGHVEKRVFGKQRWLYVSSDADNQAALAFYRKLGFRRVGRLPDLIQAGHVEILLRKGR